MKTLEEQLNSARTDVQRGVAQIPARPASSIRRRQQRRKSTTLVASGAIAIAVVASTSFVFAGEDQSAAGTSPVDGPPATSGLTPEEDQAIEDVVVGDDDETVSEDGSDSVLEPREPTDEEWIDLSGGLSVAAVVEGNGHLRIWTKSGAQAPTPAASTDVSFLPVPVSATQIAVLIPTWQFYAERGIDVPPYETSDRVKVHWFEGSDAVDTVTVDWTGDERFGVAFVDARHATILDVEFVTD